MPHREDLILARPPLNRRPQGQRLKQVEPPSRLLQEQVLPRCLSRSSAARSEWTELTQSAGTQFRNKPSPSGGHR